MFCLLHGTRRSSTLSFVLLEAQVATQSTQSIGNDSEINTCVASSGPLEETLQKPKRRYTFPSTGFRTRFSSSTATKSSFIRRRHSEPPVSTLNSPRDSNMTAPCSVIYGLIDSEFRNSMHDEKRSWVSLLWCASLLKQNHVDVCAAIKDLKLKHTEWKNDTESLESFVRNSAPRLFAMLIYSGTEKLLDQFH